MLIAVDVKDSTLAKEVKTKLRERGINALPDGRMVMFCPSYRISETEIDLFANELENILKFYN